MTKVLDHGFVEIDNISHGEREGHSLYEPLEGLDLSVVNGARVSFGKRSDALTAADRGLIRALVRDHHGTPFEHGSISWRVRAPIFVMREWHRHRTASISEASARYTPVPSLFYTPAREAMRSQIGKSNAYTFEQMADDEAAVWRGRMYAQNAAAFKLYEDMLEGRVAKEIARSVLPVSMYSEMIWTCSVRNLMGFLQLRNAAPALYEIRVFAEAIEAAWVEAMPVTAAAFVEFGRVKP